MQEYINKIGVLQTDKKDLGQELMTFVKPPKYWSNDKKRVLWGLIILSCFALFLCIIFGPAIILPSYFLLILFVFIYTTLVFDSIVEKFSIYEKGILINKKEKEELIYYVEIASIKVRKNVFGGILCVLDYETKYKLLFPDEQSWIFLRNKAPGINFRYK